MLHGVKVPARDGMFKGVVGQAMDGAPSNQRPKDV
jgi:hypothetical protein